MEIFAKIQAIGSYLPEKKVTNEEIAQILDTSDDWMINNTGIRFRHIASPDQTCSDLAICAVENLLKKQAKALENLDFILVATSTPEYASMPSTACVIQKKLGLNGIPALDISAACSGFVYGLEMARNLILSRQYRKILLLTPELYSRILNWSDRNTSVLFGDGAGACLICPATDKVSLIAKSYLYTNVDGYQNLYRSQQQEDIALAKQTQEILGFKPLSHNQFLHMNGRKVYLFAIQSIVKLVKQIMESEHIQQEDIHYIICHQANYRIIQRAAEILELPADIFYVSISEHANTSAASIPLALADMESKGLLKKGMLLLTVGFGGGLTYGINLIYW